MVKTAAGIRQRVAAIRKMAHDDEVAHSMEDALWLATLQAIATGAGDSPKTLAEEALKTQSIGFSRWCA